MVGKKVWGAFCDCVGFCEESIFCWELVEISVGCGGLLMGANEDKRGREAWVKGRTVTGAKVGLENDGLNVELGIASNVWGRLKVELGLLKVELGLLKVELGLLKVELGLLKVELGLLKDGRSGT